MPDDQRNVPRSRMRPVPDAPPGLELDGKGNVIPLAQRTQEGQEKARAASQASIKNPEQEAEAPAPMPRQQQGRSPRDEDPQGQQGSTKR